MRGCHPGREFQLHRASDTFGRLCKLLGLARCLGATFLVAALTLSARGQSSVTFAWDAETGGAVAGYRLYDGVASRTYTNVIAVGTATTITVAGLTAGKTYYFAVTAVGTNGLESDYSTEMSYPVPLPTNNPPTIALTFAADSGTFTAPFVDSAGTLSQSVATGLSNGGQAVYAFNIPTTGNYLVSAMVIAPSQSQNSLYVNIDAPPTDPLMIWDVPVSSTLTNATVSWRGNGNGDPASSQYNPKVFNLSAGTH